MNSELGKQIAGQVETSQQPTKCVIEKNEKGEKSEKSEKSENLSRSTASMDTQTMDELPCFTPRIKDLLTPFLQAIVEAGDTETMQDLLLLSSLVVLSSVCQNVKGVYDNDWVNSSLFAFITARAGSGKGKMKCALELIRPILNDIRQAYEQEMAEYHVAMQAWNDSKNKDGIPPKEPPHRSHIIYANSSATSAYEALNDNGGVGLTFETEGDTLADTLKTDYGNYSAGMRSAFHGERIGYSRRKDREWVEIEHPHWSILLSGTPQQVLNLIPNAENGLFSRFLFLYFKALHRFRNVFAKKEVVLSDRFFALGQRFKPVHDALRTAPRMIRFELTAAQEEAFTPFFEQLREEYCSLFSDEIEPSIFRLGLVCFRLAMVISVCRLVDEPDRLEQVLREGHLVCEAADFEVARQMVDVLLQHTAKIHTLLMKPKAAQQPSKQLNRSQKELFNALPETFTTEQFDAIAPQLNIAKSTSWRHLRLLLYEHGLVQRLSQGNYRKVCIEPLK